MYKTLKFTKTQFTNSQESIYYKHYFEEHKNNSKKTWDGIRSIISLKTNSHKQTRSLNINNKTESNPKIMAETINNFFMTNASDADSKIIHINTNYKYYLWGSVLNSIFLKPATEKEAIKEMKTNKSTGPKSIPTHILKTSNQIICKPPTYLINLSFPNKFFPDLIKTSNVIPAFKKGKTKIITIID